MTEEERVRVCSEIVVLRGSRVIGERRSVAGWSSM